MMTRKFQRIRNRLNRKFALVSLLIVVIFSFFNLMFIYLVEDTFFNRMVSAERDYLMLAYRESGNLVAPRQEFMTVVTDFDELPGDIKEEFQEEPRRPEYAGTESRHYHLAYSVDPEFIVVAEVSQYLVVRDFKTGIFVTQAIVAFILLLIAILIGTISGNRLARPIEKLAALFSESKADRLPEGFATNYPNNEIGILAKAMEQSVTRVNAYIKREQEFTSDVSHELRTPVAIIKGAVEVLQEDGQFRDHAALERIHSATLLMEQNIETLLALAREEQQYSETDIALLPHIEQAIIDNAFLIETKDVEVKVDVTARLNVRARKGAVQILLNNLIGNAFQYTSEGEVTVSSDELGRLIIKDTGEGIAPEMTDEVFERHVRGKNSAGFGVGLSLVKRLCEKYGWQIAMDSSAEGTMIVISFT